MTCTSRLAPVSRTPGFRALAWSGDWLYASRGYELLRADAKEVRGQLKWEQAGILDPSWKRSLSVRNRLTARLFRDGFHALAVLGSGGLVAAVPGAIVTLAPNTTKFRQTHKISRGTRPLHITEVPGGTVFWGEYFDNRSREEVHIYASTDQGMTWDVAYTFAKGSIRHIHNIVHDLWQNCLWIFTGDYGDECRILRAPCDLSHIDVVLQGNQQARAVAALPAEDGLYFSSDTPLEGNFICRLDRLGTVSKLTPISSSSIYGCRVGTHLFFSTMVEPSNVNRDPAVRLYGSDIAKQEPWESILSWKKDLWPKGLFQYGNAFLPDGDNTSPYLAVTTAAVRGEDGVTSLYALNS